MPRSRLIALGLFFLAAGGALFAQRMFDRRGFGSSRGRGSDEPPRWTNAPGFEKDVFTFVRIQYSSSYGRGWGRRRGGGWTTDYPDAEENLSWRLQQMTSMKVDPKG